MKLTFIKTALVCSVALTACSSDDAVFSFMSGEIGSDLDSKGVYGVATANNVAVQSASAEEILINLTLKFASEVPARINFAFNKADLDAEARAALDQQAAWIMAHPKIKFRVYGHTDKVGSNAYNQRLGQRRANAAVNYLISKGVDRKKVEAVASYGETRPVVLTEAPNRENRRTVTEVSGFFRKDGGELDGKYAVRIYNEYTRTTTEAPDSGGGLE
jgi:outer membrane protein OmpA-like peptidoglycan-associated protein